MHFPSRFRSPSGRLAPTAAIAGILALAWFGGAGTAAATTKLAHFFVHLDQRAAGQAVGTPVDEAAARAKAPYLVGHAYPVYSLSAGFVKGDSGAVADFVYLATEARSASGQEASIWIGRQRGNPGEWTVLNVSSGTDEVSFPAKAEQGDVVFTEPQAQAWYRLHEDKVLPLNDPARLAVGDQGKSLHDYQELVHGKYADKIPGGTPKNDGTTSGSATAVASTSSGGSFSPGVGIAVGCAASALVVAVVIRRKRRVAGD